MKNPLEHALIQLKSESYLNLLVFIVPILNFLVGVNIDLYAPSLPHIAQYYGTSIAAAKNTITINGLLSLAIISGIILGIQLIIFYAIFKPDMKKSM